MITKTKNKTKKRNDSSLPSITYSGYNKYNYTFIPILRSYFKNPKFNLVKIINHHFTLTSPAKFEELLEHIQSNIKSHNIGIATVTLSISHNPNTEGKPKKTKKTMKNKSSKSDISSKSGISREGKMGGLHEIIIICIDDTKFSTKTDYELLESFRTCGNTIFTIAKKTNITNFNILSPNDEDVLHGHHALKIAMRFTTRHTSSSFNGLNLLDTSHSFIMAILEGILLSSYTFLKYKTPKALNANTLNYTLLDIHIRFPHLTSPRIRDSYIPIGIMRCENIVKSVFMARDFINEPANNNKAQVVIDRVKSYITANVNVRDKIKMEMLDKDELEKLGMGLILAVGRGSQPENAPRMMILNYQGSQCRKSGNSKGHGNDPAVVLIGKGITYDTGGLDIKSAKSMNEMKNDLSGAAAVIAFILGYAAMNGKKCITVICPFAENSISASSVKPGDVVRAYDGRTVEIVNTDAEGRLLIADTLSYAVEKYPHAMIIDLATLTGQQEAVSGKMFSNILASETASDEVKKMIVASMQINELLVPLPILNTQIDKLKSYVADIKNDNSGDNDSNSGSPDILLSGLFMKQFIKETTKWIHIDIAGPSFKIDDVVKYASPEASGIGVRLLFQYLS